LDAASRATAYERAKGEIGIVLGDAGGRPQVLRAFQSGSARLRFPRAAGAGAVEAMVLNTAGGLASGDTLAVDVAVEAHALAVSTQACERVYRAGGGPVARIAQHLRVAEGAQLLHLPQPTILFDDAALRRRTRVDLAASARLTFCEGIVLGRAAMGESVTRVHVRDTTEIRVAGRLVVADALRLTTEGLARAGSKAVLAGNRGIGLLVHRGGASEAALARARAALAGAGEVSLLEGLVVARVLAPDHSALQDTLARLVGALAGVLPPRAWRL